MLLWHFPLEQRDISSLLIVQKEQQEVLHELIEYFHRDYILRQKVIL